MQHCDIINYYHAATTKGPILCISPLYNSGTSISFGEKQKFYLILFCAPATVLPDRSVPVPVAAGAQRRTPPVRAAPQVPGLLSLHPVSTPTAWLHPLQGPDRLRPWAGHRHGSQEPRGIPPGLLMVVVVVVVQQQAVGTFVRL